jgi:hypothetical protein
MQLLLLVGLKHPHLLLFLVLVLQLLPLNILW